MGVGGFSKKIIDGSFSEAAQIMWTFLAILFYSLKLGEKNVNESLSTEHTFCGHKQ